MKAKAKVGCKETSLIHAHSRKHKHTFACMPNQKSVMLSVGSFLFNMFEI